MCIAVHYGRLILSISFTACELSIFVDYICVRLNLTKLPANNLRRISTMYVRGYLQGSENGRVVTIVRS
jgi:hypothetical protein